MEYKFNGPDGIEKKWQDEWRKKNRYHVETDLSKPKYYVLDMFPYPSGAGLHVGHPLGYIASDIYSRYKRLKGFNVLHPMGFDSFGLPAEQYAIETGQHPAETTKKNIATFKAQLDKIGFCYDWDREVRTSDPSYYKWTQWIFLQLFNSYYDTKANKATPITELIKQFENEGNHQPSTSSLQPFTADEWNGFTKQQQEEILMNRRLAFSKYGEVNWCEALGTVLANDEVVNGVSERGGYPVVKKKMRQWYLRITDYADRLLEGLETVNFSDSMKEMQRNWIGKSQGAEIMFKIKPPLTPPEGENQKAAVQSRETARPSTYGLIKELSKEHKQNPTEEENILWQRLRTHQTGYHIRRQHIIDQYIVNFVCLDKRVTIEVDGGYHESEEQKVYDKQRTEFLTGLGFEEIRFKNEEVNQNVDEVVEKITQKLNSKLSVRQVSPPGGDLEGASLTVYTTRPDTIFGVDFMVVAPELPLINEIKSEAQSAAVDEYIAYVKSRSDVDRMAEKKITGCFTGAYAINPFDGREIPIWISEYVLAGYGTGAIMAVPCGDERDFKFAKHFNIPITNIIGSYFNGEEANPTKEAILENSGFINGMKMMDASEVVLQKLESEGSGKRKVNYKMRDAGFSRQRYWGEPFPIIWSDGIAIPLDETELPLELPHVDKYGPGPEGEGPLANLKEWTSPPTPLQRRGEKNPAPYGYFNSTPDEWRKTLQFAKQNRAAPTVEENKVWQAIRNRKITGHKFRRQHPIAGYIPDFVCLEKKLIIEIDGGYHTEEEQQMFDKARENWLTEQGFTMIRFTNFTVNNALEAVLEDIEQALLDKEDKTENIDQPLSNKENTIGTEGSNSPLPWRGAGGEVKRETSTMPGYAGSSWYFLRYMDPNNNETFCDRKASDYWNQVDLYIGGTEHAVGHLLYSRLWTKVLYDLGYIGFDEPFKKLVNQGMIQGSSRFIYRVDALQSGIMTYAISSNKNKNIFISANDYEKLTKSKMDEKQIKKILAILDEENGYEELTGIHTSAIHVDVKYVDGVELDYKKLQRENNRYTDAFFITDENDKYICGVEVEKMSKSKLNTHNPDDLVDKYGADTFRMYEMFLGPVEQSKPWDTKGIEGVHRFLRKLWRLFFDEQKGKVWTTEKAADTELKVLHRTIKKIEEDTERFSFNTAVSTFMICVNELADLKCHKKEILEPLLILLAPYAPHITEELYSQLNASEASPTGGGLEGASYPTFNPALLVESSKEYPVSINGKVRTNINLALDLQQADVEKLVLQNDVVQKWLEGKDPKKIIYVKNKMVNVVI